jgi:hypothetical protein
MVRAANGKSLADFGLRSSHGSEAGLLSARASYIAGFGGVANVEAGMKFGIPVVGTMAHSFVQIHDDEATAFEDFARARPDGVVLLIDTFDTEAGARKVVDLAPKLKKDGIGIRGVRIDSGDLIAMSRKVRAILDAGGLKDAIILVSGGVDEDFIAKVVAAKAPIDGFGVGASFTTLRAPASVSNVSMRSTTPSGLARAKSSKAADSSSWICTNECAIVPTTGMPNFIPASTLATPPKPAMVLARAERRPASAPWAERRPKSASDLPFAASTIRAAFEAISDWKCRTLMIRDSMSCACGSGAVIRISGSCGKTTVPSGMA